MHKDMNIHSYSKVEKEVFFFKTQSTRPVDAPQTIYFDLKM